VVRSCEYGGKSSGSIKVGTCIARMAQGKLTSKGELCSTSSDGFSLQLRTQYLGRLHINNLEIYSP
jgi:hypothetical protein